MLFIFYNMLIKMFSNECRNGSVLLKNAGVVPLPTILLCPTGSSTATVLHSTTVVAVKFDSSFKS